MVAADEEDAPTKVRSGQVKLGSFARLCTPFS